MNKDKENRVLYINHSGELLIWLLVILFIVFITMLLRVKHKQLANHYEIFMPDVDGLIVGSPVRAMGIEIGHVVKIQPIDDEVFVKFVITKKDIQIPQGTQATVEFSGMAGSKSLELYLPDENTYIDSTVPLLSVNPPKRLHDAFGLLNDMFKRIGDMITKASLFNRQIKQIDLPQGTNGDIEKFLKYTNNVLEDANTRAENFERRLNNAK